MARLTKIAVILQAESDYYLRSGDRWLIAVSNESQNAFHSTSNLRRLIVNQLNAQWEDSENNRIVEFSVSYQIENSTVNIENIVASKVSFACPTSGQVTRSIGVHTQKGQQLITSQLEAAGQIQVAIDAIAEKHELFTAV